MEKLKAFIINSKWNMKIYAYRAAVIISILVLFLK